MKGQLARSVKAGTLRSTRICLGCIFIYAAISKIESPQDFADSIASYQIVPYSIVNLWAFGIPIFELICGLLLLTGYLGRISLLSIVAMLTIFVGAILSAILRGLPISCGCFGTRPGLDAKPWVSIARDSFLLLCAILAYRDEIRRDAKSLAATEHLGTRLANNSE